MRNLLVLIILAAAGYYGWQTWQQHPEYLANFLPKQQTEEDGKSMGSTASDAPTAANPAEASASKPASAVQTAPATPAFKSRIAVPASEDGEKRTVAPGEFLVIQRASVETKDGITAIVPGDLVKLIERRGNGTLRVTNGQVDFIVKESQVTQDVAVAQEAERREYEKRYGNLR
jgi:hypothetical protein